jgi:hypothetical protein
MSELTQCPECQRKLRVPDGQVGRSVRRPICGLEFTAEPYDAPQPAPEEVEPPPERPRRARDYDDRDDDRPRRRRRSISRDYDGEYGGRPHRGSTVQILGILALCFCFMAVPCWVMGGIALSMASTDLHAMESGRMDSSGMAATKTGRLCAILGLCASFLLICSCAGLCFLGAMADH